MSAWSYAELIAEKALPANQIVKFAPWMIERLHLELPAVRKTSESSTQADALLKLHPMVSKPPCSSMKVAAREERIG
jgi:hypothetical protein